MVREEQLRQRAGTRIVKVDGERIAQWSLAQLPQFRLRLRDCANAFSAVSRLRVAKSPTISRLFPLLSSLNHFNKPKPQWTREFRGNQGEKDFVVLLFISYKGWIYTTSPGKSENLELTSVQNDPHILLDYLGFRHDDTSRNWHFIMDFDLEYTDSEGITKVLPRASPTKDELLRIVREAARSGTSGFIHIGAHCIYSYPGTSHIKVDGNTTTYVETPKRQSGAKVAYFICTDGQRVTGEELQSCLSDSTKVSRKATITMFFDMCHADAFFKDVVDLPCVYTAAQKKVERKRRTRKQLVSNILALRLNRAMVFSQIAIYGSRAGQSSGSWKDAGYEYGAATFLTVAFLGDRPSASPVELVRYLNAICSRRPQEKLRQSPYIASRYPIPGRLRLIPGPSAVS